ncbi:hypothetical protein HR10_04505 [Porphyromonas gulae]|nr:hypothetical protein HR10_04505 [Porphyromonas gulae]
MLNKALGDVILFFDGTLAAGAAEVFFHNVKTLGIGQMFRHNYCFFDLSECQLFSVHVSFLWHHDGSEIFAYTPINFLIYGNIFSYIRKFLSLYTMAIRLW